LCAVCAVSDFSHRKLVPPRLLSLERLRRQNPSKKATTLVLSGPPPLPALAVVAAPDHRRRQAGWGELRRVFHARGRMSSGHRRWRVEAAVHGWVAQRRRLTSRSGGPGGYRRHDRGGRRRWKGLAATARLRSGPIWARFGPRRSLWWLLLFCPPEAGGVDGRRAARPCSGPEFHGLDRAGPWRWQGGADARLVEVAACCRRRWVAAEGKSYISP
jgi:hypothetical protein